MNISNMEATLTYAQQLDQQDELRAFRQQFYFPQINGQEAIYFCGNSLGLQPKAVKENLNGILDSWKNRAVEAYFKGDKPWMSYAHQFKKPLSAIVGCQETEVTVMNSLTVNIHLLLLSFYRPTAQRFKILMEAGAFPSDQYAIETQVRLFGFDPEDAIIEVAPREGEKLIREEDIITAIQATDDQLSLVLIGGVNYYTGQLFNLERITEAAHEAGAYAGFDLAHAVGNVPLQLHNWNIDFAAWCSYKYLNGGPGAIGGIYIHERFSSNPRFPRLAGWGGFDEKTRFNMQKGFVPQPGTDGWALSVAQAPIMAGLDASLQLFTAAGFEKLHAKSRQLTAYLEFLLKQLTNLSYELITPANPAHRGAQLSMFFHQNGSAIQKKLQEAGIIVDYREPGVVRVSPIPLYNSFEDVYKFYHILQTRF